MCLIRGIDPLKPRGVAYKTVTLEQVQGINALQALELEGIDSPGGRYTLVTLELEGCYTLVTLELEIWRMLHAGYPGA